MKESFEEVGVSLMSDVIVEAYASIEIGMSGRDLFHLVETEQTCAVFHRMKCLNPNWRFTG
jgi:hypothetical protein